VSIALVVGIGGATLRAGKQFPTLALNEDAPHSQTEVLSRIIVANWA